MADLRVKSATVELGAYATRELRQARVWRQRRDLFACARGTP